MSYREKRERDILLYKVIRFFCMKLKISMTTEPMKFFNLGELHIGPSMFLDYYF